MRGGVMIETTIVLSVLVLLLGILIDLNFLFKESAALQEAARFGSRVAASAPEKGITHEELPEYARKVTAHTLEASGLDLDEYYIDFWQTSVDGGWHTRETRLMHFVQITVSRKKENRFYLIPESILDSCVGASEFIESRKLFERGAPAIQNPRCNPAGIRE